MKYTIQVLEWKLEELKKGAIQSRRILRRKRKRGDWMHDKIRGWYEQDKLKIKSIKKAIKILICHSR